MGAGFPLVSVIREIIDFLEFEGYIETVGNEYPTLSLLPKAEPVLLKNDTVIMKQVIIEEPDANKSQKTKAEEPVDSELLAALKTLRKTIAGTKGVPAYIVFSDATLIDMCKKRPKNLSEMLDVSGVGDVKLRLYGERFFKVLKEYE